VIVALPFPATALTDVGALGTVEGVTELLVTDAVLVPVAFVAVTVNVYAVPFVSPVTVIGEPVPDAVKLPMFEVTVYDVIAEPPVLAGAVNEIVAEPFPAVAETPVGAPGALVGTTALLGLDDALVPIAFVAVTENVYVVPLTSPVTVIGEPLLEAVKPPVLEVAVYVVIADPPLLAGAVNVIVAEPFPAVAETLVGAPGVVAGVTEFEVAEAVLVPVAFVAVTVNVYAVPFVRPVMVIGEPPLVAVKFPILEETV
jgi:hypothetical protein